LTSKMKKICSIAAVLIALAALSGCDGLIPARYDDSGVFIINGERYAECAGSVCAAYIGEKYSRWNDMVFYLIPGCDSAEYLTLSRSDGGNVFKKESLPEPVLSEINITKAYFCRVTETKVIAESELTDRELISAMVDAVTNGEECVMPGSSELTREIRIASEDYPFLYYRLSYMEDTRADGYLYDRGTGKCVFVGKTFTDYAV